jgi:pyrrolidone-carboxylate peptidase
MAATAGTQTPAGFIHVPGLPGQGDPAEDGPGMELETMVRAISIAIGVVAARLEPG